MRLNNNSPIFPIIFKENSEKKEMLNDDELMLMQKRFTFWQKLTKEQKEHLSSTTKHVTYTKGESVYDAQRECLGVMLIKSGELRTYILSDEGKEITLYRQNAGEICVMSASCVIKQITFDVHIEAEKDSEVLLLEATDFSKLMAENIYVENFALKATTDKFSEVMWVMEQILFMSFDQRLAVFLLDEIARSGSDEINLTHEQIAKYMGSAREVVSRMLKYFESEEIISRHRGGLKVLSRSKLQKLI